jgi:hypothetical protein
MKYAYAHYGNDKIDPSCIQLIEDGSRRCIKLLRKFSKLLEATRSRILEQWHSTWLMRTPGGTRDILGVAENILRRM